MKDDLTANLNALNEAQRAPTLHKDGPLIVIAGAGSGKTRVLTYRIAYLMTQGVDSFSILALTFTNKSARNERSNCRFGRRERSKEPVDGNFSLDFCSNFKMSSR